MKRLTIGLALLLALFICACSAKTTDPSNVTSNSAQLNGFVTWNAGDGPGDLWFKYKISSNATWLESEHFPFTERTTGDSSGFARTVNGLVPGTEYHYVLCGTMDGNTGCFNSRGTFNTDSYTTFRTAGTTPIRLTDIAAGATFATPMYAVGPQSGLVYVAERAGRVILVKNGVKQATPFLNISSMVNTVGEGGLLGLAFAPDYASSGRFYVYFTESIESGAVGGDIRVEEYTRSSSNPDVADPASRRLIFEIEHSSRSNHYGGGLVFGPDNLLYISTGDGGGANDPDSNGQNQASRLGKVLRLNPVATTTPQMYAYGLRNPFRISFDTTTGDLIIGDVGQDRWEEINFRAGGAAPGANYGWPCREGFVANNPCTAPGAINPSLVKANATNSRSIVPGVVLRHPSFGSYVGKLLYTDFYDNVLRSVRLSASGATEDASTGLAVSQITSMNVDSCRRPLITSFGGTVKRLEASFAPAGC